MAHQLASLCCWFLRAPTFSLQSNHSAHILYVNISQQQLGWSTENLRSMMFNVPYTYICRIFSLPHSLRTEKESYCERSMRRRTYYTENTCSSIIYSLHRFHSAFFVGFGDVVVVVVFIPSAHTVSRARFFIRFLLCILYQICIVLYCIYVCTCQFSALLLQLNEFE